MGVTFIAWSINCDFFPGVDTWIYTGAKKVFLPEKQFGLPANGWESWKSESDWLTDDCFQKQWRIMPSSKIGIRDKKFPKCWESFLIGPVQPVSRRISSECWQVKGVSWVAGWTLWWRTGIVVTVYICSSMVGCWCRRVSRSICSFGCLRTALLEFFEVLKVGVITKNG